MSRWFDADHDVGRRESSVVIEASLEFFMLQENSIGFSLRSVVFELAENSGFNGGMHVIFLHSRNCEQTGIRE